MNRLDIFFIISIISFFLFCISAEADISFELDNWVEEGDNCTINEHKIGTCKILDLCPRVYLELARGKRPKKICGFNGATPIICCPTDDTDGLSFFMTGDNVPKLTAEEIKRIFQMKYYPREKAAAKCTEFSNAFCPAKQIIEPRIFGSNKHSAVQQKTYPHMVGVGYSTDDDTEDVVWLCGGVIISERFVLTAAHCVFTFDWGGVTWVRLGDLNLYQPDNDEHAINVKVIERIRHPNYKVPYQYHDIALLKLEKDVEFNDWIRPACLAPLKRNTTPEYAESIGWGWINWLDSDDNDDLKQITLKLISHKECNKAHKDDDYSLNRGIVNSWQLCAGEVGNETCQSESGGPLVVPNEKYSCLHDVIGITNIGITCGNDAPGVYAKVSYYVPWIESIVWPQ